MEPSDFPLRRRADRDRQCGRVGRTKTRRLWALTAPSGDGKVLHWRWPSASPRLGLPPRGLRSRQRGPRLGPINVGSSRSRDHQAGAGGRVAREGPVHDPRSRSQASHSCPCRQDRRTLYHRAPPRSERSPAAPDPLASSPANDHATSRQPPAVPKAVSPTRSPARRPDTASTTGSTCSIGSAASRRAIPPRRDTCTTLITSTAGMRRASPSLTNARAACARSISDATASTRYRYRRSWPLTRRT